VGATSLFTTAEDLTRWLDNFREPKVGGRAAVDRLQEQAILPGGKKIPYALGVSIDDYRGLRRVAHAGGDAGFRSYVAWFPEVNLGVAVVSNFGNLNVADTAQRVAESFVEARMKPKTAATPPAKPAAVDVAPGALARYAGVYQVPGIGIIDVKLKDGKLIGSPAGQQPQELVPIAEDKFFVQALNFEVTFKAEESKMQISIRQTQSQNEMHGERIAMGGEAKPVNLADYEGVYWSDELETRYTAAMQDGKLKLRHIRHGDVELIPVFGDQFRAGWWFAGEVRFTRDEQGRVNGVRLGGGRVRGILFQR
jgi:hypothetical protein